MSNFCHFGTKTGANGRKPMGAHVTLFLDEKQPKNGLSAENPNTPLFVLTRQGSRGRRGSGLASSFCGVPGNHLEAIQPGQGAHRVFAEPEELGLLDPAGKNKLRPWHDLREGQ